MPKTCRWHSPLQRPKTSNNSINSVNNNTRINGCSSFSVILEIRGHTYCILKSNNNDDVYSAVIMTVTTSSRGSIDRCKILPGPHGAMANSAFHPSRVGKWVPASAVKAKAGMVHYVSRCTQGVQVKLWDPLKTRAIPECLRGVITTRRYTDPRLPYLTLLYLTH